VIPRNEQQIISSKKEIKKRKRKKEKEKTAKNAECDALSPTRKT